MFCIKTVFEHASVIPKAASLSLSFPEESLDLRSGTLDPALLEGRFSAAAAVQGFGHLLAHLAQISLTGHQAECIACLITAAEDCRGSAAAVGNGIRQIPDCHIVQVVLKFFNEFFKQK